MPSSETLQYSHTFRNHGITLVTLTPNNNNVGCCASVEPVSANYLDLELDRVSSMSYYYHFPIILNTIFFNVFQNTIALFFLQKELNLPNPLSYFVIGICAIATTMQALLARAFKIIETPIHLTLAQKALLGSIEETFKNLKKSHGNHEDLVVLISRKEYSEIYKGFFPAIFSKKNTDFDYALQVIAQHYKTHFHILSVDKEQYGYVDFSQLPIQKKFQILAYSYQPDMPITSASDLEQNDFFTTANSSNHQPTMHPPLISLKRYITSQEYREKTSCLSLTFSIFRSLPTMIFLVSLPYIGATLQGISSLNDVLGQVFGLEDIRGSWRIPVILAGIVIGGSKATMTYVTKVPTSKQRAHKLISHCPNNLQKIFKHDRSFLSDIFKIFSFNDSLSFSKRLLIISYYIVPLAVILFGYFAAAGTLFFYAGLGLFFSNSGAYELNAFFTHPNGETPTHEATDYSNIPLTALSFMMCIAIAVLNGFFNQGWDTVKLFSKYASEMQKHLNQAIQSSNATPISHLFIMPEAIKNIFIRNSRRENIILLLTLIDSYAASVTAYYGSTQIMSALSQLYSPLRAHNFSIIFNILIASAIYITQTCFSFELYERDAQNGGNLWGKLFSVHLPECLRKTFKLDDVKFPNTEGTARYEHQIYTRLFKPTTPSLRQNESENTLTSISSSANSPIGRSP